MPRRPSDADYGFGAREDESESDSDVGELDIDKHVWVFLTSSLQFLHLFIFPLFHFYILEVRVTCGSAALCSCRRLSITCVKTWRAVFRSMPRPCSCMCPSLAFSLSSKSFSRTWIRYINGTLLVCAHCQRTRHLTRHRLTANRCA